MSQWKKVVLIAVGSIFLLIAGAGVALRMAYPPERVKKILLQEISKRLNREISFGDVSIGLFKGISITDFRCSEKPNFQAGSFLECSQFSMRISLPPLLEKKFEINNVQFQSPKIRVTRFEDGKTYNFSDLITPSTAATKVQEQKTSPAPFLIALNEVKVTNGEFLLTDVSPQKLSLSLRRLDLTTRGSSPKQPIKIRLSTALQAQSSSKKYPIEGTMDFDGHVFLEDERVKIEHFSWKTPNMIEADLQGSVENWTDPKIEVELRVPQLNTSAFINTVLESPSLPKNTGLQGPCKIQLKAKGEMAVSKMLESKTREGSLNFSLSADMKDTDIAIGSHFHKPAGAIFNLDAAGEWKSSPSSQDTFNLSRVALFFNGSSLEIAKSKISGTIRLESSISGHPENMTAKLTLDSDQAQIIIPGLFHKDANIPFKIDLSGHYQKDKELEVSRLNLILQDASVEGSGKMSKLTTSLPDISMQVKAKQFPLTPFSDWIQKQVPSGTNIGGLIHWAASVSGNFSKLSAQLDSDAEQAVIKIPKAIQKEQGTPLALSFSGTIKNKKAVDLDHFKASYKKSNLEASGKIFSFEPPSPAVDLSFKSSSLIWQDLLEFMVLPADCSIGGSAGKMAVHILGTKDRFRANGSIDFQNTDIIYGPESQRIFKKSAGIPMDLKFQGSWESPDMLNLESFNFVLKKTNFLGKANLSKFLSPKKSFLVKLETDRIPLKEFSEYLPALTPYHLDGTLQANCLVSGAYPFDTFPKASGWIEIKNISTTVGELPVKDVNAKLSFTENSYTLPGMTGKIAEIPFQFQFSLVNPVSPSIRMEANLGVIDLSSLKPASSAGRPAIEQTAKASASSKSDTVIPFHFPSSKTTGTIKIKKLVHRNFDLAYITLDWDLAQVTPQLNKVSGKAKLRTFGGEVMHIGSVEKILKIINPSLSSLDFKKVGADFTFTEGTMNIPDLWIESDQLTIGGEGSVYLPNRNANIDILGRYSGSALAAAALISITGDLTSPQIEKKSVSVLTQTLKEKVFRVQPTETK
jgi:hypothetical protein